MGWTSDPASNVLIDYLLEAGHVRDIAIWTDEEAERCRLVAFDLAQQRRALHEDGALQRVPMDGGPHQWIRRWGRTTFSSERIFGIYEPADFALSAPYWPKRSLVRGRRWKRKAA